MSNSTSQRRDVPSTTSPDSSRPSSPTSRSERRSASQARLASPLPSIRRRQGETNGQDAAGGAGGGGTGPHTPLEGISDSPSSGQPGATALATALHASLDASQSRQDQSDTNNGQAGQSEQFVDRQPTSTNNDYFGLTAARGRTISGTQSPAAFEDFEIVRRHLAGPSNAASPAVGSPGRDSPGLLDPSERSEVTSPAPDLDEDFSSLRMQGGDVHRAIYRRTEAEENAKNARSQRSQSFAISRPPPEEGEMDAENLRQPQGFRRYHIIQNNPGQVLGPQTDGSDSPIPAQPNFITRNFFEFLSLYGHFAGEDIDDGDDDDDDEVSSQYTESHRGGNIDEDDEHAGRRGAPSERSPLLKRKFGRRQRKQDPASPKKGATGTALIVLKAFIGTGVLFLPRAFLNGGLLFSLGIMTFIACLSYYCFLLLTTSRLALKGSYAEMGYMVHGKWVRGLISGSLVISQLGFAASYIVFTAENLRAFVQAVTNCKTSVDMNLMILLQLAVFIPLSLYRNLNNISYVIYVADLFIIMGLVYLYYYSIATMAVQHGLSDVVMFNRNNWPLFIGTAVFTFEGIGLIIPIQDGMRKPEQLPKVLGGCMVIIGTIFVSMGALSYAAYGSETQTVIMLNLDQGNKFVNAVQFIYSLAILLSGPVQIFPAITILERGLFRRSGKFSKRVKWRKNAFRCTVVLCAAAIAWVGAGDLDKFVSLVGSFACVPLVYIYPPLIHRKAVATARWQVVVDVMLIVFGFITMGYTSVLNVASWFGEVGESKPPPSRGYCDL